MCSVCNDKGVRRYYHDAGDHFGSGRAPNSEFRWKTCECQNEEAICKHVNLNESGHPIFRKPKCECPKRPGVCCDYHTKYYGDCRWFSLK